MSTKLAMQRRHYAPRQEQTIKPIDMKRMTVDRSGAQDRFSGPLKDGFHTEERVIRAIQDLRVEGAVDVYVRRDRQCRLTVAAEYPEDIEKVRTILKGQSLVIRGPDTGFGVSAGSATIIGSGNVVGRGNVVQHFYGPVGQVAAGDIVNGGHVVNGTSFRGKVAVGITLPELPEAEVQGASELTLIDVLQEDLQLEVSGAGAIHAQGSVRTLRCDISGDGQLHVRHMDTLKASIDVSGAGSVDATVRERIKLRISGAANATIWGSPPDRDTRVSGAGDVEFR